MTDLTAKRLVTVSEGAAGVRDEHAIWTELLARIASDPHTAPGSCVAAALRLCRAATAGLSVLRFDRDGRAVLRWTTVGGLLAMQEGLTAPRDASACGLCLDASTTILVPRPERLFAYLQDIRPTIVEKLIVPVYDAEKTPLGTLWVAQHDSISRFDANDARVMERLALLVAPALQYLATTGERQSLSRELLEERSRRERAEASEDETREISVVEVQDAHHRTKNTLQIAANLLRLQSHATHSAQVRTALDEAYLRLNLLAGVHELLYKTPGDSRKIFMPKLLITLGKALENAFSEMTPHVSLEVTADQIILAADQAIALALFANEVLTNAYKHAFPAGAVGKITLGLRSTPEHAWILQITDNGIGMRSSNTAEGLGLTLIRAFANQLHGILVIDSPVDSSGTTISLTVCAIERKRVAALGRVP